jgi:hypothetical protein
VHRSLAFASSVLAAGAFALVRNSLDLEDRSFLVALAVASASAFALTVAFGAVLRTSRSRNLLTGVAAFVLVPLLYAAYLAFYAVAVCLVGGETCYS